MASAASSATYQQVSSLPVSQCQQCGTTDKKLSRCAQCHIEQYCSHDCQRAAWPKHKLVCHTKLNMSTSVRSFHDLKYPYHSIHKIDDGHLSDMLLAAKKGDSSAMGIFLDQIENLNQPVVQDALCFAAISGQAETVDLMIQRGVNPVTPRKYDTFRDVWIERLTAMGVSIENRQGSVIDVLLKHDVNVDDTLRETKYPQRDGALDLFFSKHPYEGPNPDLLRQILHAGAKIHSLDYKTIFRIAVYSSTEELSLLIDAGFDPKTIFIKELRPNLKGKDSVWYTPEVSLLDLAVMQAERANFFNRNQDSIDKVILLLAKGADSASRRNYCDQTYLHQVSEPQLMRIFCQAGVSPTAPALFHKFSKIPVSPMDIAHSEDTVQVLCAAGGDIVNSSFTKGTPTQQEALKRIGFDPEKGIDQLDPKGELFLTKAANDRDVSAFVALIGEGVDVNQVKPTKPRWTVLHQLFDNVYGASVSDEYDYMAVAEVYELKLINILIKHGAFPLRDTFGRTPLMCLKFNLSNNGFTKNVIDAYINYEADYYKLDPKEYKEKFFKLRSG